MTSQADLTPDAALERYHQLTATEQIVLQFLAILVESTHRTRLTNGLRDAGIKGEAGKPLSSTALTPILQRLTALQLVLADHSSTSQFRCSPAIAFHATRFAIVAKRFEPIVAGIREAFPLIEPYYYSKRMVSAERGLRELRIAVFAHDTQKIDSLLPACQEQFPNEMATVRLWGWICDTPFDHAWFLKLPPTFQAQALNEIVPNRLERLESVADLLPALHELRQNRDPVCAPYFRKQLITILLFQGELQEALTMLAAGDVVQDGQALQGWIDFLRGENGAAIQVFEGQLRLAKKITDKRKIVLNETSGLFHLLALLKSDDPGHRARFAALLDLAYKKPLVPIRNPGFRAFEALLLAQENKVGDALLRLKDEHQHAALKRLLNVVARYWIDPAHARQFVQGVRSLFEQAMRHGHRWAAMEAAALVAALDPEATDYARHADALQRESGMQSLLPIVSHEEGWQRALKALVQVGVTKPGKTETRSGNDSRLVWMIHLSDPSSGTIQPKEQVRSASGLWSKGRPVSLKRLFQNQESPDFLTDHDRRVCAAIVRENDYYGGSFFEFNWSKAMLALAGHPLVFWEDAPTVNVEVVRVEPELLVEQKGAQVNVRFADPVTGEGVRAIRETPTRCKLIEITAAHKRIADILGDKGLRVPARAKEQVMQAMQAVAPLVTIHSGIGGGVANIEEVTADALPHIHLLPHGDGLKVNLLVCPFSGDGPYFQPGRGGRTIIAEVQGRRVQTHRNMQEELTRAQDVLAACPTLAAREGESEWVIEEPDACLELLLELQAMAERLVVAWPEGEKMRVGRPVAMDAMRVQVQRSQEWFSVNGALTLDDGLILEMERLLELLRGRDGRFVPLGDGRFLALTERFRKRLAELEAFSQKQAKGRQFHPLAGSIFRELLMDAGAVDSDKHWQAHLKRIDQVQALEPALPSTLQAELRDYQVTGFRWLARLAAWGVGGCLADDMGLGKTLQAMALLLLRAKEGPSLVVAPTSVGLNWLAELNRFAPTLNGILFGGGQREQLLEALQPFDVAICSYGLLQQEADLLAKVRWNVIVLDEAQAIKNRQTKRSQSAMALIGSFRLITTGTPVENHLGEIWNLFQFINPGLLGSLESFNERFATPIERNGDKAAQKRLKQLIQPFLLRRTKNQVLEELPPRTEIVLNVEMSLEERTLYETMRRKAVEEIESLQGPSEQKHFRILAEIMRLRRVCCNSRLVLPDSPIESSKLALFWEVVEELLANRHKVLVFSQFVDHLALIRALLDDKQVTYQYLDGSTPAKERQARVEAFQAGSGDLFLISLKAGGVGINLTAADYVIHMDPWWNPAVEDQASDRAHRIGQSRPVTIYRLITTATIEEKIVALHRHKRDLADGLLEGGDMSGRLSVEDLMNMIRDRA
ncbi:MAG: DEAD/DEAH box helicase [Magnetococcales bacterium]|nr:DEAD/DEAH box helicase [Magnetococcales bacterium]